MATQLTCRQLIDFLIDYFDDSLEASPRASFERHLSVCPPCRRYLETYRVSIELGRAALCEGDALLAEAPDELVQAVLASIRALPPAT